MGLLLVAVGASVSAQIGPAREMATSDLGVCLFVPSVNYPVQPTDSNFSSPTSVWNTDPQWKKVNDFANSITTNGFSIRVDSLWHEHFANRARVNQSTIFNFDRVRLGVLDRFVRAKNCNALMVLMPCPDSEAKPGNTWYSTAYPPLGWWRPLPSTYADINKGVQSYVNKANDAIQSITNAHCKISWQLMNEAGATHPGGPTGVFPGHWEGLTEFLDGTKNSGVGGVTGIKYTATSPLSPTRRNEVISPAFSFMSGLSLFNVWRANEQHSAVNEIRLSTQWKNTVSARTMHYRGPFVSLIQKSPTTFCYESPEQYAESYIAGLGSQIGALQMLNMSPIPQVVDVTEAYLDFGRMGAGASPVYDLQGRSFIPVKGYVGKPSTGYTPVPSEKYLYFWGKPLLYAFRINVLIDNFEGAKFMANNFSDGHWPEQLSQGNSIFQNIDLNGPFGIKGALPDRRLILKAIREKVGALKGLGLRRMYFFAGLEGNGNWTPGATLVNGEWEPPVLTPPTPSDFADPNLSSGRDFFQTQGDQLKGVHTVATRQRLANGSWGNYRWQYYYNPEDDHSMRNDELSLWLTPGASGSTGS